MDSNNCLGSVLGSCVTSQRAQTQRAIGSRPQRAARCAPCSSRKAAASGSTWQRQRRSRRASDSESSRTSTTPLGISWFEAKSTPVESSLCTMSSTASRTGVRAVMRTCKCGFSAKIILSQQTKAWPHFLYRPQQPSRISNRYPGRSRRCSRKASCPTCSEAPPPPAMAACARSEAAAMPEDQEGAPSPAAPAVAPAPAPAPAPGECEADAQPLLWEVTYGSPTKTAWLLASYKVDVKELQPIPSSIEQAVQCSDIAYMDFACTPGANGGLGNYMAHCKNYSLAITQDSIATRLSPTEVQQLSQVLTDLAAEVPAECAGAPELRLKSLAAAVHSTDFRLSLRALYALTNRLLDPTMCNIDTGPGADSRRGGFEGWIRSQFSTTKPLFSLSDIGDLCQMFESDVTQDKNLLAKVLKTDGNATWRAMFQHKEVSFAEALKCGDMQTLAKFQEKFFGAFLGKRNAELASRLQTVLRANDNDNKTILFALDIAHMVDLPGVSQGIPYLMVEAGYTVKQADMHGVGCTPSPYSAPGAKELGYCLTPKFKQQPESCISFAKVVGEKLSEDQMMGRIQLDDACHSCDNSTQTCACTTTWENTTLFNTWCTDLQANGTSGQVLEATLKRNPQSTRTGQLLVEKTFNAKHYGCYALSCGIPLLEEQALRNWYKSDPDLDGGSVQLAPPASAAPGFNWLMLLLMVLFLICLLSAGFAIYYVFVTKKTPRTRSIALVQEEKDDDDGMVPFYKRIAYGGMDIPRHPPFPIPWDKNHVVARTEMEALRGQIEQDEQTPAPMYDTTLLKHVMRARELLVGAGNEAVQTIQQQTLQSLQTQSQQFTQGPQMLPPSSLMTPPPMRMQTMQMTGPFGAAVPPQTTYQPITGPSTYGGFAIPGSVHYHQHQPMSLVGPMNPQSAASVSFGASPSSAPFPRPTTNARLPYGGGH
mmetsp:Transcript_156265/g.501350  ORF Transcript_156265/g.501350 Transcript_156265/m.501350 type:complete len:935 (+) Transcript_156265:2993-5797(+)